MTTVIIITVAAVFLAVFIWGNWRRNKAIREYQQGRNDRKVRYDARFNGSATTDGKHPQETTFTDKN